MNIILIVSNGFLLKSAKIILLSISRKKKFQHIENTPTLQKKAFLACLYESGSRPEEFLRLSNLDCRIDTNGAILILRGKTGERRIRIVSFAKLLQQWLDIHPLRHYKQFPLWISQATNYNNQPLGLRGAQNN